MTRFHWHAGVWFAVLSSTALASFQGYDLAFKHVLSDHPEDIPRALLTYSNGLPVRDLASTQFTVCLFAFLENQNTDLVTLFNFSSNGLKTMSQMTLLVDYNEAMTTLYISDEAASFNSTPHRNVWTHVCIAWDSSSGQARLYIDGDLEGTEVIKQGAKIYDGGYFILGANPFSNNFDFIPTGKFAYGVEGKLTQVNIWNTRLSADEVNLVSNCKLEGNVVGWSNSSWRFYGNVLKQTSDAPCGSEEVSLEYLKNQLLTAKQQFENQLKESQQFILTLSQKFDIAENEIAVLNQQLEAGANEMKSLKQEAGVEISSLNERFDEAEKELNSFKLNVASEISKLKQTAGTQINSLSKQLNDAAKELNAFKKAGMDEIRTLKETAGSEINSLKLRLDNAERDLSAFKIVAEQELTSIKQETEKEITSLKAAAAQCCGA